MSRRTLPLCLNHLVGDAYRTSIQPTIYNKQSWTSLSTNTIYKKQKVELTSEPKSASSLLEERNLIYEVLSAVPSQREARHFLKRFINIKEGEGEGKGKSRSKKFVESLFTREKRDFLGLIKIQQLPFEEGFYDHIAPTLVHLKRLGLLPLVLLDHDFEETELTMQERNLDKFDYWKKRALNDALKLVDAIENAGGRSRVLDDQVFFLSKESHKSTKVTSSSTIMLNPKEGEYQLTVKLKGVFKSLEIGQIPVIIPIGTTDTSVSKLFKSDSAMVGISQALGQWQGHDVDLDSQTSVKLMIINKEGGIPSSQHSGAIGFINLEDEYSEIMTNLQSSPATYRSKQCVATLNMIKRSLATLPVDSSAIIVPAKSSRLLISNWIKDKPLYSTTQLKWQKSEVNSSVIRRGFEVQMYRDLKGVNIEKLSNLLELAFAKPLDKINFWKRVETCLSSVIIAGDYQGAAIVTNEHQTHPYLDKFAVNPKKQGGGIADILWKKLTSTYPELTWRSRKENGVNKWYFERSDGNVRIPDTNWVLFWYGRKGIDNLDEYYQIAKDIPPSFNSMKHK